MRLRFEVLYTLCVQQSGTAVIHTEPPVTFCLSGLTRLIELQLQFTVLMQYLSESAAQQRCCNDSSTLNRNTSLSFSAPN